MVKPLPKPRAGAANELVEINVRGARTHNLANLDLDIPRNQLVVFTGLSGSGKSSLVFDTIYAEGQRRYVESLSTYARQFLSMMEKPDVEHIQGLSPAIAIEQKSVSHNPRSTVGTVTEIYDYLRLLYARVGIPHCPTHHIPLQAQTITEMVELVCQLPEGAMMMMLAPTVRERKGEQRKVFDELRQAGFVRARVNGEVIDLDSPPKLPKNNKHTIEVVVDRFKVRSGIEQRVAESLETTLTLSDGIALIEPIPQAKGKKSTATEKSLLLSSNYSCPTCRYSVNELEPRLFSFNSPAGACSNCDGLGVKQFFDVKRVVRDPDLSLAEGVFHNWGRNNHYYFLMISSVAKHYGFDTRKPYSKLSKKHQQVLLYGSGEEIIHFEYRSQNGNIRNFHRPFEGVIPNLERRFHEAHSERHREEYQNYISEQPCPDCEGTRLGLAARHVTINGRNLPSITALSIDDALPYFQKLTLKRRDATIAATITKEIVSRLEFLQDVGLNYLTLDRSAATLSGGEAQRIRLASQIGAGLVGVTYVLDEPTIGLHQRDNQRLLNSLMRLRDMGNTLLLVEHDEDTIRQADYLVDIGPGAGKNGGKVVAQGSVKDLIAQPESLTGSYLDQQLEVEVAAKKLSAKQRPAIKLYGCHGNNLKKIDVTFPLGLFICITGVSGSGKSTLVNHTLYSALASRLNKQKDSESESFSRIEGLENIDKCIRIDQNPIGRTPRSNPATYTGMFTHIRELFSRTPEARARGYRPGRFSFNVKGGRCEACQGDGVTKVEMHFLADIYVPCDECRSLRYNHETLQIRYKSLNIAEVLNLTVSEALEFFAPVTNIANKVKTLNKVGLSYIQLGQRATTLSGGEAQRIKLSKELSRRDTGNTVYILDEPTTGLHFHDVKQLLEVLFQLRDRGNTIIVIEHNMDVIKSADWVIDLGPEGGVDGGNVVASGTPAQVMKKRTSFTGQFLKQLAKN